MENALFAKCTQYARHESGPVGERKVFAANLGERKKAKRFPFSWGAIIRCYANAHSMHRNVLYWSLCCGKIVANVMCSVQRICVFMCALFLARARARLCAI